ncbi:hypothetical protein [Janthinobacterium agaricidamnosum]|uniref:Uncharacterized protein n=1 Tax=Janthinobacterium agaricidamnosum NBRC 102515 = DSM 9628 TaxID=1349767 RepID=W0V290_9BURK|nr:hypothetical protein [Janthinobacterium agaricidamnosum]CDG81976.1 hypothetical protein GJA_1323 [Janthinobacterium agaricidamnosum NBRC 102515 = DSM 9628]
MSFIKIITQFHFTPHQHWPWLAGLTALCFSAAMGFVELPALRAQNGTLARQVKMLQTQLRTPLAAGGAQRAFDLRERLATIERLPVVASDLQELSVKNGLLLSDATYKPLADSANSDVSRMEIDARLKGAYPALKKTLADLLAGHDGLALESLALRRSRAAEPSIDIEVRFTYFYRKAA